MSPLFHDFHKATQRFQPIQININRLSDFDIIVLSYIIKAHQLGIRGIFVVAISYVDHCLLFDLAEHREKSWFHSVAVESVLPGLVQRLVCHGHNLRGWILVGYLGFVVLSS